MQESKLERSVIDLIPRSIDLLQNKLEREKDYETVQTECKWIIDLMLLFPEMDDYKFFLEALRLFDKRESGKEIAELVFYTLSRFFGTIFTPRVIKPAQ